MLIWINFSAKLRKANTPKSWGLQLIGVSLAGTKTDQPRDKGLAMSRRTLVLLAATAIAGITLAASVSTDASAARKQARAAVRPAAAVVVVTDYGPPADRVPRCFDSPILYPVPPCY